MAKQHWTTVWNKLDGETEQWFDILETTLPTTRLASAMVDDRGKKMGCTMCRIMLRAVYSRGLHVGASLARIGGRIPRCRSNPLK
jgi:hypothetical protein